MKKHLDTVPSICRHVTSFGPPECGAEATAMKQPTTGPSSTTSGDWPRDPGDRERRGRRSTGVPEQLELPLTVGRAHHD